MGAATKWDVTPRYNVTFNKIEQVGDKVNVSFTDGTNDCYDMVVGADGLYSKTRTTVFDAALLPQYTGQAVWRYNLPRPADVIRTALFQGASGGKAGYCPLNDDTMYLLLVMREPGNPWIPRNQLAAAFKDRLKQFGGRIAHIRDTVEFDPDKIVYRPLEAILVPAPWYRGGVLLIGDAAHGTTPHLGQGAAQAVEDAVVLGAIAAGDLPVADIVRQFMERRYARCKLIWESSLQIGRWEIDDDPEADVPAISRAVLQSLSQDI
jgi:2-polyprenyl-6-methoxyphenol hydroxylase-like FAD-dependent oxidoreductase